MQANHEEKTVTLPFGWQLTVPASWHHAVGADGAERRFIFQQDGLTLYVMIFQAQKQGIPAPASAMKTAFLRMMPAGASLFDAAAVAPAGMETTAFTTRGNGPGQPAFQLWTGFFCPGTLVSARAVSQQPDGLAAVLPVLATLHRAQ